MTTASVVLTAIQTLRASGLEYAPRDPDDLKAMGRSWVSIFSDIPDDVFETAVNDYLRLETRWPAPAKIREYAKRVKLNNNRTVSGGQFEQVSTVGGLCSHYQNGEGVALSDHYPAYRVTPGLWKAYEPRRVVENLPPEVLALEAKYQGEELPTDEEWDAVTRVLEG